MYLPISYVSPSLYTQCGRSKTQRKYLVWFLIVFFLFYPGKSWWENPLRFLKPHFCSYVPLINKLFKHICCRSVLLAFLCNTEQARQCHRVPAERPTAPPALPPPPIEVQLVILGTGIRSQALLLSSCPLGEGVYGKNSSSHPNFATDLHPLQEGGLSPLPPPKNPHHPLPQPWVQWSLRVAAGSRAAWSSSLPDAGGTVLTSNLQAALTIQFKDVWGTIQGRDLKRTMKSIPCPAAGAVQAKAFSVVLSAPSRGPHTSQR